MVHIIKFLQNKKVLILVLLIFISSFSFSFSFLEQISEGGRKVLNIIWFIGIGACILNIAKTYYEESGEIVKLIFPVALLLFWIFGILQLKEYLFPLSYSPF